MVRPSPADRVGVHAGIVSEKALPNEWFRLMLKGFFVGTEWFQCL